MTEPTPAPSRRRGTLALIPDKCTSCLICAQECPDWCIHISAHTETEPPTTPRGRPRVVKVLDDFVIDMGHCQRCGICVEVCPFDALEWVAEPAPAEASTAALRHDTDRLASWLGRPAENRSDDRSDDRADGSPGNTADDHER